MNRSMFAAVFTAALIGGSAHAVSGQPAPAPAAPTADDLAKAADATAEAAAVGTSEADLAKAADAAADVATVPAAGAPKASSDDIDLSSLGLDPGASSFDDKLSIYGFADVRWSAEHWVQNIPGVRKNVLSFGVGNLNLYLAKNLMPKARVLAEVRFTFLPNGTKGADGVPFAAVATEPSNSSRPAQWGGIVIERLYGEYDLTDHLTIRAGHWLTPYGIWNIDHGSPAIIAVNRPYIIGEQFFPEHQTGLDLFGNYYNSGFKLTYHLTASNGRGADEAQADQDNNLALGGRVEVETPVGLKVGASYYEGRYTGFAPAAGAAPPTYLEAAYAADAQFDRGGLRVQAEVSVRERHYEAGARSPSAAGFAPDGRDFGFYVLAGYRFDTLWSVMPYAYYEHYRPQERPYFSGIDDVNVGLNFRPTAGLVLKVQAVRATFADGPELLASQKFYVYSTQASWVF